MKKEIIIKEYPFLKRIFEKRLEMIFHLQVKRLGQDILILPLSKDEHSWAGSRGTSAYIIYADSSWERAVHGGWYSENGRIIRDDPPIPLWESLLTPGGEIDNEKIINLRGILVNHWDHYNNPSEEYDNWTIYIRPDHKILSKTIGHLIQNEVNHLREIVGERLKKIDL
jgi:hypothetical protein